MFSHFSSARRFCSWEICSTGEVSSICARVLMSSICSSMSSVEPSALPVTGSTSRPCLALIYFWKLVIASRVWSPNTPSTWLCFIKPYLASMPCSAMMFSLSESGVMLPSSGCCSGSSVTCGASVGSTGASVGCGTAVGSAVTCGTSVGCASGAGVVAP